MATKTSVLTKAYVDSIKKAHLERQKVIKKEMTEAQKADKKVRDRITFILNEYHGLWDSEVYGWNFGDDDYQYNSNCRYCYGDGCDKCSESSMSIWDNTDKYNINGIQLTDHSGYDEDDEFYEMGGEPFTIIDKNGKEFFLNDYDASIPIRWLFEDFTKEITEGKKKYEEKIKKSMTTQQKERIALKAKESEILKHLKQRLTKEEKAVIARNVHNL